MMRRFVETQTLVNENLRKQSLHLDETLRQLETTVDSLASSSKVLETQISLLAQISLGPFPERHANVVTTSSEKQIENPKESDNEVKESYGERIVEIEENPPTPPGREVVEKVEKEALMFFLLHTTHVSISPKYLWNLR